MPDVLIRKVSLRTLRALKRRAKLHHSSLQAELKTVLDDVARTTVYDPVAAANRICEKLKQKGIRFSDSTELVAEDRRR
jgi:plasmid stability protein